MNGVSCQMTHKYTQLTLHMSASKVLLGVELDPCMKGFGKTKFLLIVQHFTWRVICNKVPTRLNLKCR